MLPNIPVQRVQCVVDGVEVDDLSEVVPPVVAGRSVREVGDVSASSTYR